MWLSDFILYKNSIGKNDSGGQDFGNIKFFDLLYKTGPVTEIDGINMCYIGNDVPQLFLHNYIACLLGNSSTINVVGIDEAIGNENMYMILKDGMPFLMWIAEGGTMTPEMVGLPSYGTYLGESFTNNPYVFISYDENEVT